MAHSRDLSHSEQHALEHFRTHLLRLALITGLVLLLVALGFSLPHIPALHDGASGIAAVLGVLTLGLLFYVKGTLDDFLLSREVYQEVRERYRWTSSPR